jgi:alpha,alpha-trehalase
MLKMLLIAVALVVVPMASASAAWADASPQDLYGPLFEAVQLERVFPDSKTFVDMIPRESPAAIMQAYAREKPAGRAVLAAFVARHFAAANEAHPIRRCASISARSGRSSASPRSPRRPAPPR